MIEVQDITVAYEDKVVLNKLNLTVYDGETLVILGGSGSGKSTLLRLIIGLGKPTSGRILIDGVDITALSEDEINKVRRKMGMVFQYSALFDSMTVKENVAFGLRQHTNLGEAEIDHIAKRKLRMVGLSGRENYMPRELSGGMKKRVSLARAIALDPKIILYDEPTSGLDPITSEVINRLILSMKKHFDCTSLVVTHDMNSAFRIADRIALLDEGAFVEVSEKEKFKNSTNGRVQQFIHGWKRPGKEAVSGGERQ